MTNIISAGELRLGHIAFMNSSGWNYTTLLSAPGTLPNKHLNPEEYVSSGTLLSHDLRHRALKAFLAHFNAQIDRLPQTKHWEETLEEALFQMKEGNSQFMFNQYAEFNRWILNQNNALLLNAPLDHPLLGSSGNETEGMLSVRGAAFSEIQRHLLSRLEAADDVTNQVVKSIEDSWAHAPVSMKDLYFATLFHHFKLAIEERPSNNAIVKELLEFQRVAYQYAITILETYGGVFLSDVVGLGKTWTAMAVLAHYENQLNPKHAVVVASPSILEAWKHLSGIFKLSTAHVSIGKLELLFEDGNTDREILVIDESHAFRNQNTNRYEAIQRWLRPDGRSSNKQVILLSATPQNNHVRDIISQLALFPDQGYQPLPYPDSDRRRWEQDVKTDTKKLKNVLQHIVVRRTRHMLRDAEARDSQGNLLTFPKRISGADQQLRYNPEMEFGEGNYQKLLGYLKELSLAGFRLSDFLNDHGEAEAFRNEQLQDIKRARGHVRALYRSMLLKRMESSATALEKTLSRQLDKIITRMNVLSTEGMVIYGNIPSDVSSEQDLNIIEDAPKLHGSYFDTEKLAREYQNDAELIRKMLEILEAANDTKARRLIEYIVKRDPLNHKILVFSEYKDTLEYLYEQLTRDKEENQRGYAIGLAHGGTSNHLKTIQRFSPKANNVTNIEDEINILLASDIFAEGVNLQDADTVVNYELHWNPVRLIQRAGRIDRIGSEAEEIHIASFLPDTELEKQLKIHEVVSQRAKEIADVFGSDGHVLPSEEQFDPDLATSAYADTYEQIEDDAQKSAYGNLDTHLARLATERSENKSRIPLYEDWRENRRALLPAGAPIAGMSITKLMNRISIGERNEHGHVQEMNLSEALDMMWEFISQETQNSEAPVVYDTSRREIARRRIVDLSNWSEQQHLDDLHSQQNPHRTPKVLYITGLLQNECSSATESERAQLKKAIRWFKRLDKPKSAQAEISRWDINVESIPNTIRWARALYERNLRPEEEQSTLSIGYIV